MNNQGVKVTLVCGPPGSGKTSYVVDRFKWGDALIDMDTLYQAISIQPMYDKPANLLPLVLGARNAMIDQVRFFSGPGHVWVVATAATRREREGLQRRLKAEVVVMEVSPDECIRRIQGDPRRADKAREWEAHVRQWWAQYQRGEGETVMTEARV